MKDKVLFWLGSEFTHFSLAYYLQKMYDCELFAIIDITDKPKKFFQEQNLVSFQKKWFFHDHIKNNIKHDIEFLKNFEKKYKINLWTLAINERIFYRFYNFHKFTSDEILSILESECKLFENILDEDKPDFFITKEPAFHHLELFYQMCKMRGVKTLMLSQPNIGYRCIISQESTKLDSYDSINQIKGENRNLAELQQYLKSFDLSKQLRTYDKKHGSSTVGWLKATISYLTSDNKSVKTHYNYFGRSKIKVILYMLDAVLKKKYRQSFINKNLKTKVDLNTPFVYFPMAVDLERNLLINAPFYTNQIEIIRHIVKSMPAGFKLYVKENPSQVSREWRGISEYKEIADIPNVTLIHPSFLTEELFKNCAMVITIGGTSGFEAAFYGKPSIVFADVGYQILPSVTRVKEIEDLSAIILAALEKKVNPSDLEQYLLLLEQNSFTFDWFSFSALFKDQFYHGGTLVDVDIQQDKIKSFLEQQSDALSLLAAEHIKKIRQYDLQKTSR